MPFQLSLTTWWLLLGVLIGFVLFWLIDKLFRRDGEAAAQRELREIKKLKQQKADLESEKNDIQKKLTDRSAEVKRLTAMSEDLRDSVRSQDQKVTNLEAALAAAREQQKEDESLRGQYDDLQAQHQRLEQELNKSKENVARLNDEARRSRMAIGEKDEQISELQGELQELSTQVAAREQAAREQGERQAAAQAQTAESAKGPTAGSVTAAAAAAAAAAAVTAGQKTESQPAQDKPGDSTPAADASTDEPDSNQRSESQKQESQEQKSEPTDKAHVIEPPAPGETEPEPKADPELKIDPEPTIRADAEGSLASRHGGQSDNAGPSDDSAQKPGLLDRLRGAFSGRRPDDLD